MDNWKHCRSWNWWIRLHQNEAIKSYTRYPPAFHMASSNRTGLGIRKRRSQEVLKTSIEVLKEYSNFCEIEGGDPYLAMRDLYSIVYDEWREDNKQVSWTQKEFSSLLATHIRQPLEGFETIEKKRKVNKHGSREMHYKVIENA